MCTHILCTKFTDAHFLNFFSFCLSKQNEKNVKKCAPINFVLNLPIQFFFKSFCLIIHFIVLFIHSFNRFLVRNSSVIYFLTTNYKRANEWMNGWIVDKMNNLKNKWTRTGYQPGGHRSSWSHTARGHSYGWDPSSGKVPICNLWGSIYRNSTNL